MTTRTALGATATGVSAAILVADAPLGLGLTLTCLMVLVVAAAAGTFERSAYGYVLAAGAAILALGPGLRDADWLVAGDLAAATLCAAAAASAGRSWRALLRGSLAVPGGLPSGLRAAGLGLAAALPRTSFQRAGAVARAAGLTALLVAVFGALFSSADAAFAHLANSALPAPPALGPLPARLLFLVLFCALTGALVLARGAGATVASWPAAMRTIGPIEWTAALGALVALFASFVAVQFVVLFGGDRHVLSTAGLTYAEYAHQGFAQLLAVAILVLAVVGAALRWTHGSERWLRTRAVLLLALCGLTLVIVASALHRLNLYVDAYGATRLRLQAAVLCGWIGLLVALAGLAVTIGSTTWLPRATMVSIAVVAIGMTIANPDALIAQRNVDRYFDSGKIDRAYLLVLSADAVPQLVRLPERVSGCALTHERNDLTRQDGFAGANRSRDNARKELRDRRPRC